MAKTRKRGRDASTGRIIRVAEARARKATATVETIPLGSFTASSPRNRDREVMAALGRVEAIVASIDRRLANLEATAKDIRGGGRHNHRPDWMSA